MPLISRKKLLSKGDLEVKKVVLSIDEKGEEEYVYVREMSGTERDQFEQSLLRKEGEGKNAKFVQALDNFRAKLAVCTVCDEQGFLLLDPDDVVLFGKNRPGSQMEKIMEVAQRLNKITEDDKEELVKNSKAVQEDNSSSGSAKSSE